MCDLTSAYISGAWHGGLAVLFIVAGLLGWPQTRFILTLIFRRNPRKPIGSPGTVSSPFWQQYGVHRSQRGFAIGPILYLLGLIGVVGGVMFSSNMQVLRSNVTVQNGVTAKSDLQAAATTLAAQSVFAADGLTLCPPRSIHQSNGDPCVTAPIGLTQFSDLPPADAARLPNGYANAASTGSPVEVGVFAPGAGTRMLNSYGHLYIYCRWENQRNNPAAPAFVLLSAGDDGILQTRCGDTAAQNDDYLYSLSVAEAINRSAVWQANGADGVAYGATGSQVYIDNGGNVTVTNLNASNNAAVGNALTTNSLNALTVTVTGVATVGSLNSGSASISGPLTATNGNFTGLTATGLITGASGTFTNLNAGTASITGAATAASLTTTGDITAKDVIASMNVNGSTGNFSILDAGTAAITNGITAASLTTTGDVTAKDLIVSNNVTGGTGTFTTLNATNENVTGDSTLNNVTVNGTLTANNVSFGGSGGTQTFPTLNTTNETISNNLTTNSETVSNGLSAGSLSTSGALTAGSATLSSLNVTNNATVGGNLTTSGSGNFNTLNVANKALFTNGPVGMGTATPGTMLDVYAYNTTPFRVTTSYGSPAAYFSTGNGGAIEAVGGGSGATALFATVASGSSVRAVVLIGQPNGNTGDLSEWETGGGTTIAAVKYNGAFAMGTQASKNMLDVAGSAAIGSGYAGSIAAPANGLIVKGNVGIANSAPQATLDVTGEIRAGSTGATCTASNAGAMRYNSSIQLMQYCNGSAWNPFNPACTVGAAVGSGYCAGQIAGKNLIVAPSGCAASASTTANCSGADIQMWYQNNGNTNNNTMIYGGNGVAAQTAALTYYVSIGRTAPTNNIAEYCKSITLDGKTWHAPSVAELEMVVTSYLTGSLTAANFGTGAYWSANDDFANNAAVVTFSTGTVSLQNNSFVNEAIRCVVLE